MSKKPFDTVKGAVDFFKGVWPGGNGVHFYHHGGFYIAVSEDYIAASSNDSHTVFVCSREQFDKENKENKDMSIKKFAVDTRTLNKSQLKALKAAAKAAGNIVEFWRWDVRGDRLIMWWQSSMDDSVSDSFDVSPPSLVTYSQALRMLADDAVSEPATTKTPAQESGFEVGDLGVVVEEDMFSLGSIVQLVEDDGTHCPYWTLIDGEASPLADEERSPTYLDRIRKPIDLAKKP